MAPILPSLELRPLFSRRLMRSTSMRGGSIDERSIRERERAKRTILEISFPFSRSPVLPSFLVPRGKKEKSRQNHREETQFVEIGSNSRPRSSFVPLSLSLSISSLPLFLPRYFHSDHQVYLSRRAYSTEKVTFKPNLSRLRAFFHSARMRCNNSPLTLANGKFDTARRMIAEFREGKCTLE